MIITKLIKNKKNYTIIVDDNVSYEFDEEIILEYRLVENKEINEEILVQAKEKNRVISHYYKAMNYALKYGKNKAQIYDYLKEKGLANSEITMVISMLEKNEIIDENRLINSIVDSYIRRCYGVIYIESKLYEKQYNKEAIQTVIEAIDYDLYYENLNRLYEKIKDKYDGNSYEKQVKIKRYLLSRGYTYNDLNALDIRTN